MKYFTIDAGNNIIIHGSRKDALALVEQSSQAEGILTAMFTNEVQFADAIGNNAPRLVEIWNSLPGVTAIKKFTSRKIASERIFRAIQNLGVPVATELVPAPETGANKSDPPPTETPAVEPITVTLEAEPAVVEVATQLPQPEPAPEGIASPAPSQPSIPAADQQPEPAAGSQVQEPSVAAQQTTPFDDEPCAEPQAIGEPAADQPEATLELETQQNAATPTAEPEVVANVGAQGADVAATEAPATKKATRTKKAPTGETGVPREGSKTSQVIAMLKRDGGTTLEEIMAEMGWLKHTTRAMLSAGGSLAKKHGLVVTSEKVGDRRMYSIKG